MSDYKPIRLTRAQQRKIFDRHVGVGVLAYKSAQNEITETEFYIDPKNRMCYIANGKPVEFQVHRDQDGFEERVEPVYAGFEALIALYRDMKANPDDQAKRLAYFEALAAACRDDAERYLDDLNRLRSAARRVIADCEAVGVEPFGLQKLRELVK